MGRVLKHRKVEECAPGLGTGGAKASAGWKIRSYVGKQQYFQFSWSGGYAAGDGKERKKGIVDQTRVEGRNCKVKEVTFNPSGRAEKIKPKFLQSPLPHIECSVLCLGL